MPNTYARRDADIRADIARAGGLAEVWEIENRLNPHSIQDREQYRSELEALAKKYNVSLRRSEPDLT